VAENVKAAEIDLSPDMLTRIEQALK